MTRSISALLSNDEILPGTHLVWLQAPQIAGLARPGQFVMVRCSDSFDPFLRRPLSIHRVDTADGLIALLFEVVGRGTSWLSRAAPGDEIDIVGPFGNGYSLDLADAPLLLIGGGIGVAPLLFLSDEATARGYSVTLLMGARTRTLLYPASLVASNVLYVKATEDGSEGVAGKVTDVIDPYMGQSDHVFACGPAAMYRCIAEGGNLRRKTVQVSFEALMGCGVGACCSCTIKTRGGLRRVCKDGPVFELADIIW